MIIYFFVTVLYIYGVHASTREGMIFNRLWNLSFNLLSKVTKRPEVVLKPLFDCTPCMASVYGTISFFLYFDFSFLGLSVWIFSLTGFNYLLNKTLNK